MNEFDWHRAQNIEDAAQRVRDAADGRFLAGGQSLLPMMKLGLATPSALVDITRIDALSRIEAVEAQAGSSAAQALRIGATATHAAVASSSLVSARIPALADLAERIGDPAVRARGTIGGSLANNDPAACYPAGILALGATVHTNRRNIAADDFFVGLYETALEPDELITAVTVPIPERAAWAKFPQPASRFSLVGVFACRHADGSVRVAVTGAGPSVFRCEPLEDALAHEWSAAACERVRMDETGLNNDMHASARYRAHLVSIMAGRAAERAQVRATG